MPSQHPKWMSLPALAFALLSSAALADSFDVATYTVPTGYKQEKGQHKVQLTKTSGQGYCLITLAPSAPGTGNLNSDFQKEWAQLVQASVTVDAPKTEQGEAKNGWQNKVGASSFKQGDLSGLALLSTYSGFSKRFSVLLLTNDKSCVDDLDAFLGSMKLGKPAGNAATTPTPVSTPVVTGYKYTTTNFDDGWVATQQKDWVEIRRGNVTVRLHYGIAYTDQTRNMSDKEPEYFWNKLVQARYPAQTLNVVNFGGGFGGDYLGESDVTEAASGKRVHVALLVVPRNGQAYCYEIVTPDQATLKQMFPNHDSVTAMSNYNRFNVDKSDLPGTWENSSSAYGMYYSTSTGDFAGMRGASTYDKYIFNANGTYQYEYIGVSGFAGAQTVAQGKKNGKYTLSSWVLSTTDTDRKTDSYEMYFEGIRGGRILHLQNKQYSGLHYALLRTK